MKDEGFPFKYGRSDGVSYFDDCESHLVLLLRLLHCTPLSNLSSYMREEQAFSLMYSHKGHADSICGHGQYETATQE
jgi:hypothetical protein